jgi:hypothetical protein
MIVPQFSGPPAAPVEPGLSPLNKSAFHPEGKMNKAGSCTAAMKKNKKAGAWPAFSQHIFP